MPNEVLEGKPGAEPNDFSLQQLANLKVAVQGIADPRLLEISQQAYEYCIRLALSAKSYGLQHAGPQCSLLFDEIAKDVRFRETILRWKAFESLLPLQDIRSKDQALKYEIPL